MLALQYTHVTVNSRVFATQDQMPNSEGLCRRRAAKADENANVAVNVEANGASAKPPAPSKAPEEAPAAEAEEPVELLDPAEARQGAEWLLL